MGEQPSVAAGICAHNEAETIGPLLEQIQAADISLTDIIIVVAGNDGTADVVRRKADKYDNIVLVVEGERQGQTAAQNEILARTSSEALFLIDGDGVIAPGSLERLLDAYDGESILFGSVFPEIEDWWMRPVVDALWDMYHDVCLEQPKFSTQLGLIPRTLLDEIPPETTLDDEYIGIKARENGYGVRYIPEAVKRQHLPESFRFYFNQRKKNWAGRIQLQQQYQQTCHDKTWLAKMFLKQYGSRSPRKIIGLTAMGLIESCAYLAARFDTLRGQYHQIWYRE